ncbi:RidA family protein [Salipiger mangrovisoli]|uniref:RidA family protein n=1 Tax=Salipiger mangrovisoli TaxID=2865933 RepID=A0ABR9XBJ9_9RHOB|nr:RidA family protein [Salipiger mangrovisoli]MBE9640805.1 RidA family protein [Salipiger mangrovisoli]
MSRTARRLSELGLALPSLKGPSGSYVPFRRSGGLVILSGQVPRVDGKDAFQGRLGEDMTVAEGQAAARAAALNLLAQLATAVEGDLDRVEACLQLRGFVRAVPDFADHPAVIDGASDLIVEVLGERGQHARTALGAGSLPRGFSVELDAIFQVAD